MDKHRDKTSHSRLPDGILIRSILITLLACLAVGIVTVAYSSKAIHEQALQASETRLNQLLDTIESTLQVACFARDEHLAKELARGLLGNTEVAKVSIAEGGRILAELSQHGQQALPEPTVGILRRPIMSPFSENEMIGLIAVTPNQQAIERQVRDEVWASAVRLAWQLALIAMVIAFALLLFVVRPITAMSRYLHRMNPAAGDRLPVPAGHRHTEIGHLAHDVNELATRLVEALEEEHVLRLQREIDEKKFRAIFDNADSAIFLVDAEGTVHSCNPAFRQLFNLPPEQADDASFHLGTLSWIEPEAIPRLLAQAFQDNATLSHELQIERQDFEHIWVKLVLSPLGNELLQGVAHDISEFKEAEAKALRKALSDPLTGLANRSGLEAHLQSAIRRSYSGQHKGFALLHIDLDKFRTVIEGMGVPAGDYVLQTVAERLGSAVKRSDVLARLSADIFAVVLHDLAGEENVDRVVGRILYVLRKPYLVDGSPVALTASLGITLYPHDGGDVPTLLRQAELAAAQAKSEGGNQPVYFDKQLAEIAEQRRHLENDLRHALREQQFVLFYQPIVDLAARRLSGAEALIRWRHPERGMVPPDKFIPIVEQTNMINELGLWVLDTACRQLAEWQQAGQTWYLSINVSGKQIPRGLPPEAVANAIRRHDIRADRLVLEITEGVLLDNVAEAQAWLRAMQQIGVSLYLDDFGTGYSSLSYLKRFPLDTLKIDRSFILDIQQGPSERSLVEAIVAMARSLGLSVVAEGVETAEHARLLTEIGCHYAQGYHFSRPVPASDFPLAASQVGELLARPTDGQASENVSWMP